MDDKINHELMDDSESQESSEEALDDYNCQVNTRQEENNSNEGAHFELFSLEADGIKLVLHSRAIDVNRVAEVGFQFLKLYRKEFPSKKSDNKKKRSSDYVG